MTMTIQEIGKVREEIKAGAMVMMMTTMILISGRIQEEGLEV